MSSRRKPGPITTGVGCFATAVEQSFTTRGHGVWVPAFAGTTDDYWAIAKIPPAKACQACVSLIGRLSSFTAMSTMPPIT